MKDEMKIWENEEFGTVRTVEINGEAWLVGKDVAAALGYSNPSKAVLAHVDEEDRLIFQNSQNGNFEIPNRGLIVINDSGLYRLALKSKLESARRFKHWVTSEVLPSIRKHGLYAIDDLIKNPELGMRAFKALMEEQQKNKVLEATVAEKQEKITELTPKATYCDVVLMSDDLISVTEIAKDYGKSAQWLNKRLHEYGIQFNQRGVWHLYQPYAEGGYAVTRKQVIPGRDGETHVKEHTYWTQDGRKFLYEFLKKKGILPITERSIECGGG